MDIVFKSFCEAVTMGLLVQTKTKNVWNFFPVLALYCSGLTDGDIMISFSQGFSDTRTCTIFTATMEDMTNDKCGEMRNLPESLPA